MTVEKDSYLPSVAGLKQNVDDVLSYVLLTTVISGTESKEECFRWWNKAVDLVLRLGFDFEARAAGNTQFSGHIPSEESYEERRRAFWLVFALDRHLAFTFNEPLRLQNFDCEVLCPLPEWIWQSPEGVSLKNVPTRTYGPPTQINGTGFFEYFLPLMNGLGNILELRSRDLGEADKALKVMTIEAMLADCEESLHALEVVKKALDPGTLQGNCFILPISCSSFGDPADERHTDDQRAELPTSYGKYIVQVLQGLLEETKEVAFSINGAGKGFKTGDCIADIMQVDKHLSFMPFLFGVYLFHGSLSFLSLTGQMTLAKADEKAKRGVGAIVRAHEVALRSLDTSFQVRSDFKVFSEYPNVKRGTSHVSSGSIPAW